jgi:quercetin dioxygenase-like cupin family protein
MTQYDLNHLLNDPSALPRSTTLLRENGLRCLLLHLKTGEQIPEHQARGAITVHCLQGEVQFSAGAQMADLRAGMLVSLAAGDPHALAARQESLLLVTLSEPVAAAA